MRVQTSIISIDFLDEYCKAYVAKTVASCASPTTFIQLWLFYFSYTIFTVLMVVEFRFSFVILINNRINY